MYLDNLAFNNLSEVQIKFKIIYLHGSLSGRNKVLIQKVTPIMRKIFLKILSLFSLREVLSGKFRNRIFPNYLKKMNFEWSTFSILEDNILFLDSTYLSTLAIGYLYSSSTKK